MQMRRARPRCCRAYFNPPSSAMHAMTAAGTICSEAARFTVIISGRCSKALLFHAFPLLHRSAPNNCFGKRTTGETLIFSSLCRETITPAQNSAAKASSVALGGRLKTSRVGDAECTRSTPVRYSRDFVITPGDAEMKLIETSGSSFFAGKPARAQRSIITRRRAGSVSTSVTHVECRSRSGAG